MVPLNHVACCQRLSNKIISRKLLLFPRKQIKWTMLYRNRQLLTDLRTLTGELCSKHTAISTHGNRIFSGRYSGQHCARKSARTWCVCLVWIWGCAKRARCYQGLRIALQNWSAFQMGEMGWPVGRRFSPLGFTLSSFLTRWYCRKDLDWVVIMNASLRLQR